jgi:hypothetical protein
MFCIIKLKLHKNVFICFSLPDSINIKDMYKWNMCTTKRGGARCWWRSCFRHCATSRKVAGSIPDGITGIFHCLNLSGRTYGPGVGLASNIKEYQEYCLGGKGDRCADATNFPSSIADFSGSLKPLGPVRAC